MSTKEARVQARTLKVPGATLYYELRGSGPVLLCISGGPTDAGMFTDLAERLAVWYTVVSYDQRGHSRSTLDGEPEDIPVAVHADDAAALLTAVGKGPAYVTGTAAAARSGSSSSSAAQIWCARWSRTRRSCSSCCPTRTGGARSSTTSPRRTALRASSPRWRSSALSSRKADRATARRCSRRRRRRRPRR